MARALNLARLMSFSLTSFMPTAHGAPLSHTSEAVFHATPFPKSRVRMALSSLYNRRAHPDPLVEASIEQLWQAHKQRAPRLFNGTKFRLHRWQIRDAQSPILELQCGLTDYKTYLGTCCSEFVAQLRDDGTRLNLAPGGDAGAFLSRKIGVSAVLETSDKRVALIERSRHVGLYQQLFDTPGGHPEPSDLPLTQEVLATLDENSELHQEVESKALDRLFGSIVDEVHEEINVSAAHLSEPLLLGVVWQSEAETPSFGTLAHLNYYCAAEDTTTDVLCSVFYLSTALSSTEVDALYRLGPLDKFESTQLRWVDAHAAHGSSSSEYV